MHKLKSKFYAISSIILLYVIAIFGLMAWAVSATDKYDTNRTTVKQLKIKKLTFKAAPKFASIKDVKEKKLAFFNYFQPIIQHENARILSDRMAVLQLERLADEEELKNKNLHLFNTLAQKYFIDQTLSSKEKFRSLRRRVNMVPESLALAQAAKESGWGTSRFAIEANNYFGQWCYKKGCGVIPSGRASGKGHEVRKFKSPQASVRAYLLNINYHRAYRSLRDIRAKLLESNLPMTGIELAKGLDKYSERGAAYVKDIQALIRYNDLE